MSAKMNPPADEKVVDGRTYPSSVDGGGETMYEGPVGSEEPKEVPMYVVLPIFVGTDDPV